MIVLGDHVLRDAAARHVREQPLKHESRVNAAEGVEKSDAVVRARGLELLKVFLIAKRYLGLLAREIAKDVFKFGSKADHGVCQGAGELLLIGVIGDGHGDKRCDFLRERRAALLAFVSKGLGELRALIGSFFRPAGDTPVCQSLEELLRGGLGICVLRLEVLLVLAQEVAPVLDDVVHRKVNEPQFSLVVRLHQVLAQMVNGWKAVVVICLGKV